MGGPLLLRFSLRLFLVVLKSNTIKRETCACAYSKQQTKKAVQGRVDPVPDSPEGRASLGLAE
jgi:hypothetical protein